MLCKKLLVVWEETRHCLKQSRTVHKQRWLEMADGSGDSSRSTMADFSYVRDERCQIIVFND